MRNFEQTSYWFSREFFIWQNLAWRCSSRKNLKDALCNFFSVLFGDHTAISTLGAYLGLQYIVRVCLALIAMPCSFKLRSEGWTVACKQPDYRCPHNQPVNLQWNQNWTHSSRVILSSYCCAYIASVLLSRGENQITCILKFLENLSFTQATGWIYFSDHYFLGQVQDVRNENFDFRESYSSELP